MYGKPIFSRSPQFSYIPVIIPARPMVFAFIKKIVPELYVILIAGDEQKDALEKNLNQEEKPSVFLPDTISCMMASPFESTIRCCTVSTSLFLCG